MNLSIIINSCDKYEFIWDKFFTLFNKYWDFNINAPIYFLTENKPINRHNIIPLTPSVIPWSHAIRFALDNIKTKYLLWLQDDYFLRKTITQDKFNDYLDFIDYYNVDRFGIHNNNYLYSYDQFKYYNKLKQNSLYTISMQSSIWNAKFLKSCLNTKPETIWHFELDGTDRLNQRQHNIYFDPQNPSWYKEALRMGKYTEDYYLICKEENI